jgi:FMN reductase
MRARAEKPYNQEIAMTAIRVVSVSGSLSTASRTSLLVKAVVRSIASVISAETRCLELGQLGPLVGPHLQRESLPREAEQALAWVENAHIIVAGSPVYKGAYTGLFKHFFDFVDPAALVDIPVVLAATGGSDRHALVVEHALRPLFSFFRAHTIPTSLYATADAFKDDEIIDPGLRERVALAAQQAVHLANVPTVRRKAERTVNASTRSVLPVT